MGETTDRKGVVREKMPISCCDECPLLSKKWNSGGPCTWGLQDMYDNANRAITVHGGGDE